MPVAVWLADLSGAQGGWVRREVSHSDPYAEPGPRFTGCRTASGAFARSCASRNETTVASICRGRGGLAPLVIPAEFAPGHLPRRVLRRVPAPALAERFHEEQAPASLLVQWGDAIFEFCGIGRAGVTVPDLDKDKSIGCRQPQADRRVPTGRSGRLHSVGNELGDEQFGRGNINGGRPFPK